MVVRHVYSVLGAETVTLKDGNQVDLIKIRNPWGFREHIGDWDDNDTENWNR